MKKILTTLLALTITGVMIHTAHAQYDDLYYNPDRQRTNSSSNYYNPDYRSDYNEDYAYQESGEWDDDDYEYFDEYDYRYSSRIRRFHRSYSGFDYYSNIYTDVYFYDPWAWSTFGPGTDIYISIGNPWGWNRWNRWNRWNSWSRWNDPWCYSGFGWNSWGWNSWHRPYNYWGAPYYGYYGWNSWNAGWGHWGGGGWAGGGWGGGFNDPNPGNNTFYGPRRTGSVRSSDRTPVRGPGREAPTRTTTDQRDPGGLSPTTAPEGRTPVRNNPADRNTPRFEPQPGGNNPGGGVKPGGNSTSPDRKNPRMDKVDQTVPGGNLQPGQLPTADDGLKPYPGTRTGPERKEAIPSAKSPAPSGSKLKSPDKSESRGLRKSDAIRNNDFFRSNSRSDRRSESTSPRSTRSRSESTSPRPAPGRTQEARPSSPRRSSPSARPSAPSRPAPSARPSSPSRSTPSARPSSPSRSSSPARSSGGSSRRSPR